MLSFFLVSKLFFFVYGVLGVLALSLPAGIYQATADGLVDYNSFWGEKIALAEGATHYFWTRAADAAILAETLSHHVHSLASDTMQGRMTGAPETKVAARYIADVLATAKITPAGDDGTYFQRVPLIAFSFEENPRLAQLKCRFRLDRNCHHLVGAAVVNFVAIGGPGGIESAVRRYLPPAIPDVWIGAYEHLCGCRFVGVVRKPFSVRRELRAAFLEF